MTGAGNGQRTVTLTAAGCVAAGGHTLGCVACGARADLPSDHVSCSRCGKRVSNVVPVDTLVVRAWVECPECVAADPKADAIDRLREWMPVDWSSEVITGQVRADLLLVLGLAPDADDPCGGTNDPLCPLCGGD